MLDPAWLPRPACAAQVDDATVVHRTSQVVLAMGQNSWPSGGQRERSCQFQPSLAYRAADIYHGYYLGDLQCSGGSADQKSSEIRVNWIEKAGTVLSTFSEAKRASV